MQIDLQVNDCKHQQIVEMPNWKKTSHQQNNYQFTRHYQTAHWPRG